ncbi:MAG TPA: PHB depolymerase family esterase, partial [Polyangiaceae bacterium]|nr:PHB depolymerase family esterase [Polyangiaceae bacterium]
EQETAFCDRPCSADADCASLGATFRCQNRSCREPDAVAPTTCSARTLAPGDNERSVVVGNTARNYVVHVPEDLTGDTAVPLIVDFHTLGGVPSGEAENSGYRELADQEGLIVAWPEGIEGAWNIGPCCTTSRDVDDVAFARALVEQVKTEACIDVERVYAVGVAMGAGMAYELGCDAADVFAGIAASSFDLLAEADQPCSPSEAVDVISFRGTADVLVPYEGGAQPAPNLPEVTMNFLGAVGTFERWAELNQCSGAPSQADANGCSTYANCADGVNVTLCTTEGGMTDWGSAEIAWAALNRRRAP